jgi:hypothetical protein
MAYTGELEEKTLLRQGKGTYRYTNNVFKYQGEWKQGKKHGMGIFTFGDGSSYEGEFVEGEIIGAGLRRWPNGSTYSGDFFMGEMEGEGIYISNTGEKYEGTMKNNQRHGEGELTQTNGDVYQGEFHTNRRHGKGTEYLASGEVYNGEFVRGVRQGSGIMAFLGGQKYEGSWVNGGKHGDGIFEDSKAGFTYNGRWENDTPLSIAKNIVAVDCEMNVNEENGNRELELKTAEKFPEIKFMCTGDLPETPSTEDDETGADGIQAIPPLQPILQEEGRALRISAYRITTNEVEENVTVVNGDENGVGGRNTKVVRTPVCLLVPDAELDQLSEDLASQSKSKELSEAHVERVSPPPTIIFIKCESGYGKLNGYSVRPDISEGTYELSVTGGNGFDALSTSILGELNTVCFELSIKQGKKKR